MNDENCVCALWHAVPTIAAANFSFVLAMHATLIRTFRIRKGLALEFYLAQYEGFTKKENSIPHVGTNKLALQKPISIELILTSGKKITTTTDTLIIATLLCWDQVMFC